jgi:hypothetical protein
MKPASEVIEVNLEEWETLLERARREPLDEASYQKLQAALRAFRVLTEMIGKCGAPHLPINVKLSVMWSRHAKAP